MMSICRWWLVGAGALALAGCTDPNALHPDPPVKLVFTEEPVGATAGIPLGSVVAVAIQDESGHTVTSAKNIVTLAIETNPGGATLAGAVSPAAVDGCATFPDLVRG